MLTEEALASKWVFPKEFSRFDSCDKSEERIAPILLKGTDDSRGENVLEYLREYSWKERLQKISQMLFPSRSYMREWYEMPPNQSTLFHYLFRFIS